MNPAKIVAVRTKNFVAKHKVAVAVIATTTTTTTVVVMEKLRGGALREVHEFLDERNLSEDFTNWIAEKM